MCGIAGIFHFDKDRTVDVVTLNKMRDSLVHRGPDGFGSIVYCNVGLAHRRLSIIDLTDLAAQPFKSADGRFTIVFNGEIFNFLELKADLRGHSFRSKSDTEVLLYLYQLHGEKMLEMLNGMFAFAIYDTRDKELFIARDRIGVKPLYYQITDTSFYFGSEPKAIFSAGLTPVLNDKILDELLLFRYVAGQNTTFRDVKRLLPGHWMKVKPGGDVKFHRWWNLASKVKYNRSLIPKDPFKWFEDTFNSSVSYRTISDVPVGVMLSGGLDSGAVAASLHSIGQKELSAFTVAFKEKNYNEGPLARKVADKFGLNYHEIQVNGQDLLESLSEAAWYHDEPLVHQNDAQMLALSKYAKKFVTVLLSGEGGDEFLGGYVRYKPLKYHKILGIIGHGSSFLKHLPVNSIVNRFDKLARYAQNNELKKLVILNSCDIYPNDFAKLGRNIDFEKFEYRNLVFEEAKDLYPHEPARQAMYMDLFIHMASIFDRNDRMTMGAGIECRVPFMDYRLMEMIPALDTSFLLRGKKGKFLLYNSIAQKLPPEVLSFKKLGFSVPWEAYFNKDERFKEFLSLINKSSTWEPFTDLNYIEIAKKYHSNDFLSTSLVRQIFMFDLWKKTFKI